MSYIKIPLLYLAVLWLLIGQILMLIILIGTGGIDISPFVDFVSRYLYVVRSLRHLDTFDSMIASQHHALMWMFSSILVLFCLSISVNDKELKLLGNNNGSPFAAGAVMIVLGVVSANLEFYDGAYTFGAEKSSMGFSILSSIGSFVIPFGIRLLKIAYAKKRGVIS